MNVSVAYSKFLRASGSFSYVLVLWRGILKKYSTTFAPRELYPRFDPGSFLFPQPAVTLTPVILQKEIYLHLLSELPSNS